MAVASKKCDVLEVAQKSDKSEDDFGVEWDELFMGIAVISAQRSKDPVTQVGAVIVTKDKELIGTGYNGMPNGSSDDKMPWGKEGKSVLHTKYPYVCHAELNAVANNVLCKDLHGTIIYTTLYPCSMCARLIVQFGISEVVYKWKKKDKEDDKASKRILKNAGVRCRKFVGRHQIRFDLGDEDSNGTVFEAK